MIVVTRLNGSRFAINPDLVERIHESPDTTLVMVGGAKYIVTEPMADVIGLIAGFRAQILNIARELPSIYQGRLSIVADEDSKGLTQPTPSGK